MLNFTKFEAATQGGDHLKVWTNINPIDELNRPTAATRGTSKSESVKTSIVNGTYIGLAFADSEINFSKKDLRNIKASWQKYKRSSVDYDQNVDDEYLRNKKPQGLRVPLMVGQSCVLVYRPKIRGGFGDDAPIGILRRARSVEDAIDGFAFLPEEIENLKNILPRYGLWKYIDLSTLSTEAKEKITRATQGQINDLNTCNTASEVEKALF